MVDPHDFVTGNLNGIPPCDSKIQPQIIAIRDIVHAAKLLRLLKAKETLIASQLDFVRNYLKENA
jgi:hypothetical protein